VYASPDITTMFKARRVKWVWHRAYMGEMRNAYRVFIEKSEGRRPL
jgi:hypothetical protein